MTNNRRILDIVKKKIDQGDVNVAEKYLSDELNMVVMNKEEEQIFSKLMKEIAINKNENLLLDKYKNMTRAKMLQFIFDGKKINYDAVEFYLDKVEKEENKQYINQDEYIYFQNIFLSERINNSEKYEIFNLLKDFSFFNYLKCYNNLLGKHFNIDDFVKNKYFFKLLKKISTLTAKAPSIYEKCKEVIRKVEIYYLGFEPLVSIDDFSCSIIEFCNGEKKNTNCFKIIITSLLEEYL
ncbi:MAG: DUF3196 family protein [Mycoplasmataceae bacterium]|jgi:hypothetical protein|nr:DUF3196 family protein [Mycoplasmataceae bacterium]